MSCIVLWDASLLFMKVTGSDQELNKNKKNKAACTNSETEQKGCEALPDAIDQTLFLRCSLNPP